MSALIKLWPSISLDPTNITNDILPGSRLSEAFNDSRDNYDWLYNVASSLDCSDNPPILVKPMPSLFSNALPPCGLNVQVAYENIVHSLRRLWLHHSISTSILSMCEAVCDLLVAEELANCIGTLTRTKTRTPWRREYVFAYELRWAKYFVREAEMMERWMQMSELQREKQELTTRLYPVPKELNVIIRNKRKIKGVHKLWMEWHEGKRNDMKIDQAKKEKD